MGNVFYDGFRYFERFYEILSMYVNQFPLLLTFKNRYVKYLLLLNFDEVARSGLHTASARSILNAINAKELPYVMVVWKLLTIKQ